MIIEAGPKTGYEARQTPKLFGYVSDFGRSTAVATCPFCGLTVRVFVWSFAGHGKKCPKCGASLGSVMCIESKASFERRKNGGMA